MPDQSPDSRPVRKDQAIPGTVSFLRLFGVPIRLHFTFLLLLIFLIFIGVGGKQSGLATAIYILALFGSVLAHELGHTLVSRSFGIRTVEIVMFPIGGVSRPERSPKAREELWIALAGPLVNVLIAAAILGWLSLRGNMAPITELLKPSDANLGERIAFGNLVLAAFNLLPAYPMDGGRVLRGLLARWKTEEQATEIAARTGRMFAILMGLFGLLSSNFLLMFIALFVYLGAAQEGAAVRGRLLTTGYKVRAAMVTDFRTLPHGASIRDAGDLLLATSQHDFPVVYGDRVIGLLGRSALIRAMLQQGPDAYVSSAMDREFTRVSPEQDLSEAMPMVSGTGGCALVMEGDQILGMLTAENLSEFLLLRQVSETQARLHAQ